jgi:hypothetical protein
MDNKIISILPNKAKTMYQITEIQDSLKSALKQTKKDKTAYNELKKLLETAEKLQFIKLEQRFDLRKINDKEALKELATAFLRTPMITKTTLIKDRGWTEGLIKKYLPKPDLETRGYPSNYLMLLYSVCKVEQIETISEVKEALKKIAFQRNKQSGSAQKAAKEKREKAINWVKSLDIQIPIFDISNLIKNAVYDYNAVHLEKEAHLQDDCKFLARIAKNYLRHSCTEYERILKEMEENKIDYEEACELLKKKINTAILRAYPNLSDRIAEYQESEYTKKSNR